MSITLKDIAPPIREISKYGYAAVAVYALLFESAHKERETKQTRNGQVIVTGGTSHWSHKAIAETLKMGKAKVIHALDELLDGGFVTVVGRITSTKGSKHRVYRIIHPSLIEAQRHALEIIGEASSVRQKRIDKAFHGNLEETEIE
jgi:hypothetical protein